MPRNRLLTPFRARSTLHLLGFPTPSRVNRTGPTSHKASPRGHREDELNAERGGLNIISPRSGFYREELKDREENKTPRDWHKVWRRERNRGLASVWPGSCAPESLPVKAVAFWAETTHSLLRDIREYRVKRVRSAVDRAALWNKEVQSERNRPG